MSEKLAGRTARFTQFAIAAAQEAVDASDILSNVSLERLAVTLGNGSGGLGSTDKSDPFALLKILPDMAASNLSIKFGAKGPVLTTVAACVSSTQAIGEALRLIRLGEADAVLAGGTEARVTAAGMIGFCLLKALSTRNDDPAQASRPFDVDRDGFVLAEGAAMFVVEELGHARERRAPILAELLGYAQTSDAYHLVMPDRGGEGAARCIRACLADAGVAVADIDHINAHGTSTPLNDISETRAVKEVFAERAYEVPMSSIKSMMGHALGGAGAIETVAAVRTLQTGIVPPTINLTHPDPQCDLDYVPNEARMHPTRTLLKNSFGFGGQNACLILRRPPDE
jgi:3-oxoacyl-[acyl-carrier-protein] synthase II